MNRLKFNEQISDSLRRENVHIVMKNWMKYTLLVSLDINHLT